MLFDVDVPSPDTVEALAQALRADRDHVIVQQTRGSGDAAGAERRIGRLIEELPFPAYVAVVDTPSDVDAGVDSSRYLATALSRRIGEPGLYVVSADSTPTGIRIVGTGWDETLFQLQVRTDAGAVESGSGDPLLAPALDAEVAVQTALAATPITDGSVPDTVSLSDATVDELVQRERDLEPYERPDADLEGPLEPWSIGKRWMVGTTVGGILLAVFLQSLWGWPGWRRKKSDKESGKQPGKQPGKKTEKRHGEPPRLESPRREPPDLATARRQANDAVTALAEELADAPAGPTADRAALAREVAEPLLESDDPLDLVGAQALARAGRREVAIAGGGRRKPFRCCFFDPRHAEATTTAEWQFGDSEVEVPVCRPCLRALAGGRAPEALVVRRLGRVRPYYEGDSVWARTGFGSLSGDVAAFAEQVMADRRRSR